ncbi:LPD29 domain-containing protein [Persephonella sp.]
MIKNYEPIFVETDHLGNPVDFEYLFQDLPLEFQNALRENRRITARDLKKMLKRFFPKTKFYVRTSRYAGGSSVDIRYTDGPALEKVENLLNWDTKGFDGMYDLSYSKRRRVLMPDMTIRELEFDWYGYVSVYREYSKEAYEKAIKELGYEGVATVEGKPGYYYVHTKAWDIQRMIYEYLRKIDL